MKTLCNLIFVAVSVLWSFLNRKLEICINESWGVYSVQQLLICLTLLQHDSCPGHCIPPPPELKLAMWASRRTTTHTHSSWSHLLCGLHLNMVKNWIRREICIKNFQIFSFNPNSRWCQRSKAPPTSTIYSPSSKISQINVQMWISLQILTGVLSFWLLIIWHKNTRVFLYDRKFKHFLKL